MTYTFQPYDVLQINRTQSGWPNFATLRIPEEASRAVALVDHLAYAKGAHCRKVPRRFKRLAHSDCHRRHEGRHRPRSADGRSFAAYATKGFLITTMTRTDAVGVIREKRGEHYIVRLPNWQADGVHLDTACRAHELATGRGRAKVCRCVYCPGYGKGKR
jgi:hypothetical protein